MWLQPNLNVHNTSPLTYISSFFIHPSSYGDTFPSPSFIRATFFPQRVDSPNQGIHPL